MARRKKNEGDLAREARFIFQGTVIQSHASNMAAVPATYRTAIVKVDHVLQAPESIQDQAGETITVHLEGQQHMKEGQQATFYTNIWLYGDSLAVRSLAQRAFSKQAERFSLAGDSGSSLEATQFQHIRERVENADLVVQGRVESIRLSPEEQGEGLFADDDYDMTPVSEHDPLWQEAVIVVAAVEKGSINQDSVVIRFPSSTDIQWYNVPKFEEGQQGVFMLQKQHLLPSAYGSNVEGEFLLDADTDDAFIASDPADFQSIIQLPLVRRAINQRSDS